MIPFPIKADIQQFKGNVWIKNPITQQRDAKILLQIPDLNYKQNQQLSKESLKLLREWTTTLIQKVASDSFQNYLLDRLKEGEVKVYTSINIMFNIYRMILKHKQNNQIVDSIFRSINDQCLNVFKAILPKYPQSEAKGGFRKFKQTLQKTDRRESDQFDHLIFGKNCNVKFQYRQDGKYFTQIMKVLKYVTQIASNPFLQQNNSFTNFQAFNLLFQSIFNHASQENFINYFYDNFPKQQLNFNNYKEFFKKVGSNKPQDKCDFIINQKIAPNAKSFTNQQIQQKIFKLTDSSVLRVMTKWLQELKKKLQKPKDELLNRVQPFKDNQGNFTYINSKPRQYLFEAAEQKFKHIQNNMESLKEQFKLMLTNIYKKKYQFLNTNNVDGNLRLIALRIHQCTCRYMNLYLNQIIHSLLQIPTIAAQKYLLKNPNDKNTADKIKRINLITLKIGDLLRSRCKGSQSHIIKVYQMIRDTSKRFPHLLKIIKIKDRLDQKDNDVLINVFFMGKIQCEVQLSILSQTHDKKSDHYGSYNHFIYEIIRAQLGPIAQFACILAQHDPVIKKQIKNPTLLNQLVEQQSQVYHQKQLKLLLICISKIQRLYKFLNWLPFFCKTCLQYKSNVNPQFYKKNNMEKICNQCYQQYLYRSNSYGLLCQELFRKRDQKQVTFNQIQTHFICINFQKKQKLTIDKIKQNLNGFLVGKNTQKPNPLYFQQLQFKGSYYFVCDKKHRKQENHIHKENKIMFKLKEQKQVDQLLSKFFIFIFDSQKFPNDQIRYHQNQQQKTKIHTLICRCQNRRIHKILGNTFQMNKTVIFQQNSLFISQIHKKQNETLDLQDRKITTQLNLIKQNHSIIKLYAPENQIRSITFISKLPNLRVIKLKKNRIPHMLANFSPQVQQINLSQNTIKKIQFMKPLKKLKLRQLKLGHNEIQIIPKEDFKYLEQLQVLYLNHNKIKNIQNLDGLKNLKILHLNNNIIDSSIQCLEKNLCLSQIYLSSNKTVIIQSLNILQKLKLKKLQLKGVKIQTSKHYNTVLRQSAVVVFDSV